MSPNENRLKKIQQIIRWCMVIMIISLFTILFLIGYYTIY